MYNARESLTAITVIAVLAAAILSSFVAMTGFILTLN